ncbi:sensor histidine kinase [Lachnoclostridium sp. Marseille-P6806]|uniref:sensor histidine kinase n=1 Tax=Lachnoclostridium sp. Marseille-P6806 TaxID=2364793 RepID=UPI00102F5647|nr:sensor histidine kinase [Lachnoclostridium sp. Marseille-P6806]
MKQFKNISIRKKILISMLIFTLLPIILVAAVATTITYQTMRDQIIYDHRMSSGWLQDRLSLDMNTIQDRFYDFEVDKAVKNDIYQWCVKGETLNYSAQWRIITLMNTLISMDSRINSIEIHNLSDDSVLVAARSGAHLDVRGNQLDRWFARDEGLQSNLMFMREENELLAIHQIHRFDDKLPIAVVVARFRPYQLQNILDEIKTVPEETILVFNDQNELLEADYGTTWNMDSRTVEAVRSELASGERKEESCNEQFWFYRSVNNGKIQVLLTVPNKTIVDALYPTVASCILVAVVAVMASIICSTVYSKAVSRPIRQLSSEMKNVTLNEYSGSILENRGDEIGILQDSFNHMIARNRELIAQQYQAKIEKRNAQLRALQAQINPHFMYNTLQVIGGMALEKGAPEIYSITLALSDIMRYCLNFSKEMIALEEEITYLQSYVIIQNERFDGRVHLKLSIAPETQKCLIPKLILQPLAENSFEHGLPEKEGPWLLEIESSLTKESDLLILVKDNGVGLEKERLDELREKIRQDTTQVLKSGSHIGLANVHARIRLRSQNEMHGVTIASSPEAGTTIRVLMPAVLEGEVSG